MTLPHLRVAAFLKLSCIALVGIALCVPVAPACAQKGKRDSGSTDSGSTDSGGTTSTASVVRIEEDWELVVSTPDANSASPQVNCLISPFGNADSYYATFELNHHSATPDEQGGLQLLLWNGENQVGPPVVLDGTVFATAAETVSWTQTMRLENGLLIFELIGGNSTTWGTFGKDTITSDSGGGELSFGNTSSTTTEPTTDFSTLSETDYQYITTTDAFKAAVSTTLTNLEAYNPQVSVEHSGIAFGANRVTSLVLKRVRYVKSDGQVVEDTTARPVHQ